MPESELLHSIKEVGGAFKLGTGVLGKSAIAIGILLIAVIVAAARLHSDIAIIGAVFLGTCVFLVWFFSVLKFAGKHPDIAVLEGAEWSGYQRFQASAKGLLPSPVEQEPSLSPGLGTKLPKVAEPKQPEGESS
jgi:hypothetical protein